MKKNGLNIEHFQYHITINYDKQMYQKINCDQMMSSCNQLRKLVAKVRPEGRMSLEPWYMYKLICMYVTFYAKIQFNRNKFIKNVKFNVL